MGRLGLRETRPQARLLLGMPAGAARDADELRTMPPHAKRAEVAEVSTGFSTEQGASDFSHGAPAP